MVRPLWRQILSRLSWHVLISFLLVSNGTHSRKSTGLLVSVKVCGRTILVLSVPFCRIFGQNDNYTTISTLCSRPSLRDPLYGTGSVPVLGYNPPQSAGGRPRTSNGGACVVKKQECDNFNSETVKNEYEISN